MNSGLKSAPKHHASSSTPLSSSSSSPPAGDVFDALADGDETDDEGLCFVASSQPTIPTQYTQVLGLSSYGYSIHPILLLHKVFVSVLPLIYPVSLNTRVLSLYLFILVTIG